MRAAPRPAAAGPVITTGPRTGSRATPASLLRRLEAGAPPHPRPGIREPPAPATRFSARSENRGQRRSAHQPRHARKAESRKIPTGLRGNHGKVREQHCPRHKAAGADGLKIVGLKIIDGHFPANAAWLALAAICHNLTRAAGCLAGGSGAKARGATIRGQLIAVAARIARHGRGHITLHLPEGWHRETGWMNLFETACGPPATAA